MKEITAVNFLFVSEYHSKLQQQNTVPETKYLTDSDRKQTPSLITFAKRPKMTKFIW